MVGEAPELPNGFAGVARVRSACQRLYTKTLAEPLGGAFLKRLAELFGLIAQETLKHSGALITVLGTREPHLPLITYHFSRPGSC